LVWLLGSRCFRWSWVVGRTSGGLAGQPAADGVEIDQGGGPRGLQSALGGADVAGLAGAVAVGEQPQQPLDPRPGPPQVFSGGGIVERLAGGDQTLLFGGELDLPAGLGRAAAPPSGGSRDRPSVETTRDAPPSARC
jgi:hypothetical protein